MSYDSAAIDSVKNASFGIGNKIMTPYGRFVGHCREQLVKIRGWQIDDMWTDVRTFDLDDFLGRLIFLERIFAGGIEPQQV
jgi:hypothetical protein